jgi:hypothetical protein
MECKKLKNEKNCPCSYDGCSRKGVCCDCVTYHRTRNEIPGCFFPIDAERSWDRSIKNFINIWK